MAVAKERYSCRIATVTWTLRLTIPITEICFEHDCHDTLMSNSANSAKPAGVCPIDHTALTASKSGAGVLAPDGVDCGVLMVRYLLRARGVRIRDSLIVCGVSRPAPRRSTSNA